MTTHSAEVQTGERFEFGANWANFLKTLDDERILRAEASLSEMLGLSSLTGKMFLDVGSGSGLFSLAARRLGARVFSFDFDPQSVACTRELRRRYFPDNSDWTVEEGSALDRAYLDRLGGFDIVYSWGVLHHTGSMWAALNNIAPLVNIGGRLFIAIYNDQGNASLRWKSLKRLYNRNRVLRHPLAMYTAIRQWMLTVIRDSVRGSPLRSWRRYKEQRGMSAWHDVVDWIGGYPFEVAKPEEIFDFFAGKGFVLLRLKTCAGGLGCNEFVFLRSDALTDASFPLPQTGGSGVVPNEGAATITGF
ncbi:class I SAM-dependent methyltransferase [Caenimonas terrae]|uniref:Class I SAM-dependent methyltransferase n=1 Tax=Caenimonas terrae TaxID=696074 RepID=A0ABW0NEM1_9BURK